LHSFTCMHVFEDLFSNMFKHVRMYLCVCIYFTVPPTICTFTQGKYLIMYICIFIHVRVHLNRPLTICIFTQGSYLIIHVCMCIHTCTFAQTPQTIHTHLHPSTRMFMWKINNMIHLYVCPDWFISVCCIFHINMKIRVRGYFYMQSLTGVGSGNQIEILKSAPLNVLILYKMNTELAFENS